VWEKSFGTQKRFYRPKFSKIQYHQKKNFQKFSIYSKNCVLAHNKKIFIFSSQKATDLNKNKGFTRQNNFQKIKQKNENLNCFGLIFCLGVFVFVFLCDFLEILADSLILLLFIKYYSTFQ
jgi:hypothetical protein